MDFATESVLKIHHSVFFDEANFGSGEDVLGLTIGRAVSFQRGPAQEEMEPGIFRAFFEVYASTEPLAGLGFDVLGFQEIERKCLIHMPDPIFPGRLENMAEKGRFDPVLCNDWSDGRIRKDRSKGFAENLLVIAAGMLRSIVESADEFGIDAR